MEGSQKTGFEKGKSVGEDTSTWWVYILRCADGTFYTGIATDVDRRAAEHNAGTGAKYTRGRGPVKVVYREERCGKSAALRREAAIKKLDRPQKEALVKTASAS